MNRKKSRAGRRLLGATISFLLLAAIVALFFAYRERAVLLHRPVRSRETFAHLPYYAWCSFYRMLAAYLIALAFSIPYGMLAARSRFWERILIPAVDVAQSVPVIGFFPAAIYFFVSLAHGSRFGVEMAAVFLIFTSQAWNMVLGVYESVKTIPADSMEALDAFGLSGWLKFKRLLMPACVPKLVYNSILSWVAGWYFLIACEIITVGPVSYRLPGLGSFLMEAADRGEWIALAMGLLTLLGVIVAMDIIVWQPLTAWSEKFRYEFAAAPSPAAAVGTMAALGAIGPAATRTIRLIFRPLARAITSAAAALPAPRLGGNAAARRTARVLRYFLVASFTIFIAYAIGSGLVALGRALLRPWPLEARQIPLATLASTMRMVVAYAISLAWTVPCALWASESPRFSRILNPVAEIVGSIPATALFPLIVVFVIQVTGGMNLASILLILTGMQWYLLFNLLAGVSQIPEDLKEAARGFGLSRFATWRKLVLPAVAPSLITGSLTAWGGGWNALILSEYFPYQGHIYKVAGLGALLDEATYHTGNSVMILLSLLSMVLVVLVLNRLVWRRLYEIATERYRLDY